MPQAAGGLACQHGSSGLTWKSSVLGSDLALRMEWDGGHAKLTGALPRSAHREVQGFPLSLALREAAGRSEHLRSKPCWRRSAAGGNESIPGLSVITSSEPACLRGDHEQLSSASQFSPIWLLQSGWEILRGERFARDGLHPRGFPRAEGPGVLSHG